MLGDAVSSKLYADCQQKHASVVEQYDMVGAEVARINAEREAAH